MMRDAKFLNFLPSQQAAASLMMALNLTQAKNIDRTSLKFKHFSSGELTDIFYKQKPSYDIKVGSTTPLNKSSFLEYPICWCKHMEKVTGLNSDTDILPVYLNLVMHANTTLFDGKLIPTRNDANGKEWENIQSTPHFNGRVFEKEKRSLNDWNIDCEQDRQT